MATQEELQKRLIQARLAEAAKQGPSLISRAKDFITGEKEDEGFPELGTTGPSVPALVRRDAPIRHSLPAIKEYEERTGGPKPQGEPKLNPTALKMAGAYATQADPKAIADIAVDTLKSVDPNVSQGADESGNPTITFEGKTYYVNAPGASGADAFQALGQIGMFAPAAKAGAAARGIFMRMLNTGVLSATTSVAADVAGGEMGSKQGMSLERAAMAGIVGGAMEGIAPALKVIWRKIFGSPRFFDPATGKLTEDGVSAARNAGLDPVDMDRRLVEAFSKEMVDEKVPGYAATRAYERAYGVPFTRGEQMARTGSMGQAAIEESMRAGQRGPMAKQGIEALEATAEKKVGQAVDETLPGKRYETLQEAGEPVTAGVARAEQAKRAMVDEAYDAAAPLLAAERVQTPSFSELMKVVKKGGQKGTIPKFLGLDPASHPQTILMYKRLGKMYKKVVKADKLDVNEVNLLSIERERRLIVQKLKTAKGEDRTALIGMKDSMDDWFSQRVDDVLFTGDDKAIAALVRARKRSSEYKGLFTKQQGRTPDDVGAVIEKILHSDPTPEQTINYVFGASALGRKQTSAKVVKRLKEVLGEDSEGFQALRDAAWTKLSKMKTGARKTYGDLTDSFDEVMTQNKSLMDELYTPQEQTMMKGVMDAIRAKTPDAVGRAQATKLRSALKWFLHVRGQSQALMHKQPFYGGILHRIGTNIPGFGSLTQTGAVKKAGRQIPKPRPSAPMAISSVLAGSRLANPEQ